AQLLVLSAVDEEHLKADAEQLATKLTSSESGQALNSELVLGRPRQKLRVSRVVFGSEDQRHALEDLAQNGITKEWAQSTKARAKAPRQAWLLPGQGSQFPRQSLGLYQSWPAFRERFDALSKSAGFKPTLAELCYSPDTNPETLRHTDIGQPLIVAFQIALGESLMGLGIYPDALVGHSVGELSAAALAGIISPEQAVALAAKRGELMQTLGGRGAMLAVLASPEKLSDAIALLPSEVVVAAYNGPAQTVLAGPEAALQKIEEKLTEAGLIARAVPVQHAFHAPAMREAGDALEKAGIVIETKMAKIPLFSSVYGRQLEPDEFTLAYMAKQVREPVRFTQAFKALSEAGVDAFVDLGPGSTLSALAQQILGHNEKRPVVALCRPAAPDDEKADWRQLLTSLGRLWIAGANLHTLPGHEGINSTRLKLPPLPRLTKHLDLDGVRELHPKTETIEVSSLLHRQVWRSLEKSNAKPIEGVWIIMGRDSSLIQEVSNRIRQHGAQTIVIQPEANLLRLDNDLSKRDMNQPGQLLWIIGDEDTPKSDMADNFSAHLALHHISRAVQKDKRSWPLWICTESAQMLPGDSDINPRQTSIAAMGRALFDEQPALRGRVVDIAEPDLKIRAEAIVREFEQNSTSSLVALREGKRWVSVLETIKSLPKTSTGSDGGVVLILGGTGGIGREFAKWFANSDSNYSSIIIAGRTSISQDALSALGVSEETIHSRTVDVNDANSLSALVDQILAEYGRLDTIVHAAGHIELGALSLAEPERIKRVLSPKLLGVENLAACVRHKPVGRVVLLSSVAGLIPELGRGLVDYAAANAYLDAVALREDNPETRWSALAYSRWHGVGMAKDTPDSQTGPLRHALKTSAALDAFGQSLNLDSSNLVIADPRDVARWNRAKTEQSQASLLNIEAKPTPKPAPPQKESEDLESF
ncbi:SDR family NAD(P)-dependent oxidoreductase, partial [Myxococcota bacterium]|nr:SDR family NAD(P)-dependent oxidoreductase [Myxococcota bacterium]